MSYFQIIDAFSLEHPEVIDTIRDEIRSNLVTFIFAAVYREPADLDCGEDVEQLLQEFALKNFDTELSHDEVREALIFFQDAAMYGQEFDYVVPEPFEPRTDFEKSIRGRILRHSPDDKELAITEYSVKITVDSISNFDITGTCSVFLELEDGGMLDFFCPLRAMEENFSWVA